MKNFRLFMAILCLVALFATGALAEDKPSAAADAEVKITNDDHSTKTWNSGSGINEINPQFFQPYPGHVNTDSSDRTSNDPRMVPFHHMLGNKVHESTLDHLNGVVPEDLEGADTDGIEVDIRTYPNIPLIKKVTDKSAGRVDPSQRLILTTYQPVSREVAVVGRAQVMLKKDGKVPERPLEKAWHELWKATNGAQFYYVEFSRNAIGLLEGMNMGLGGGVSTLINPTNFMANAIAAIIGSIGKSDNNTKVFKGPVFTLIAYNDYVGPNTTADNMLNMKPIQEIIWPDAPRKVVKEEKKEEQISAQETKASEQPSAPKPVTETKESSAKAEIMRCPSVKFRYNSATINTEEQKDAIRCMNEKIANEALGENEYWAIIGETCILGSDPYNLVLGGNRANRTEEARKKLMDSDMEVAKSVAAPLVKAEIGRTGSLERSNQKIIILSGGEFNQKYGVKATKTSDSPEREAYLVKITDTTKR
jgi:hypothetical protein